MTIYVVWPLFNVFYFITCFTLNTLKKKKRKIAAMGKKKSSTPAERRLIWETFQKTKSVGKVSEVLGFSRGKVNNAIHYYKKNSTFNDLPRKKQQKTTKAEDRRLVRISKSDPFLTSTEIRAEMETHYGVQISAQTVRRRLKENNLNGRIVR